MYRLMLFIKFGEFWVIIYSDVFPAPFSSPSGTPIMNMLVYIMLSYLTLRLSSFFLFILFSLHSLHCIISMLRFTDFFLFYWFKILLSLSTEFFISVIELFSSRISAWSFHSWFFIDIIYLVRH